jgi:CPA1 family monovalent cation:H+ antiporter
LLVAGLAIAMARLDTGILLTRDLLFNVLLPPLLFEAALYIPWREMVRERGPVGLLSSVGVLIATAVVAAAMHGFLHWPAISAIIFGVIVAATDPVAVIMTFKDAGLHGRLKLIVEAESLLNDGVAATLFGVAILFVSGHPVTGATAARELLWSIAGGIGAGLACAGGAILLVGRTDEHLIETTFTAVAAYGSFILADHMGCSGVLATVAAGMLMGNAGVLRQESGRVLSSRGRDVVIAFWDVAAFLVNSLIFILMGFATVRTILPHLGVGTARLVLMAIVFSLAGRALTVYPLSLLFARTPLRLDLPCQHVLFWGGLRGALALALTLSLPETTPYREQITQATFGVVTFSVLVQGATITPLMKLLRVLPAKG